MAAANTGSFRLVRCPKCLNVLPEPPNVTVYRCGGCDTTLRAKIRVSNGQNAATKQVRQDSDDYSVATTVSNGVPPQTKDLAFGGAAMESSCTAADAPSTETVHESNGASTNDAEDNGHAMSAEKIALEVANSDQRKEDCNNSDGKNTSTRIEGPSDLTHPSANDKDTDTDSDREETTAVEESPENSEACREREDGDTECNLNASDSDHDVPLSEGSKSDSELKGAVKTEAAAAAASKKSYLVRMQSHSCDLREAAGASMDSLDFRSSRTSLQSKSFRASEPLQSKIMKTVDELRGDLSEFFRKPSDCKPKTAAYHPPRPSKQGGYVPRAAVTSRAPLTAYHAATKRSGQAAAAARLSRSGQVAPPRGLPSLRYRRRHRACSCCHSGQMEMVRQCPHDEYCHSCRPRPPPCHRPWKQEAALLQEQQQRRAPPAVKETKRRVLPRNHCRPVLRGAPFVVCSRCLRLVQLPTGFAVPSRGTRRLQCGSCSEVLSYSYRDPGKKKLQSPFGDDEYSTDDYEIHQVAAGDNHRTGYYEADPFSYSEEYGVSYSTEDEQPLHVSRNSSFGTIDGRDGKDSKLHRLMGYSSASEMLRHSPGLYESFEKRTPCRKNAAAGQEGERHLRGCRRR